MYVDAILCKPTDFDFGEGYAETWDIVYPSVGNWTLEECHTYLDEKGGDMPSPDPWNMDREELVELLNDVGIETYDDESDEVLREAVISNINDGTIDGLEDWQASVEEIMQDNPDDFSPMMNYYYPLPNFDRDLGEAQALLYQKGGAVAIATVGDQPVLTLTGGGMDLSWDICQAYVLLGYYPPFHFTDLPRFAGLKLDEKARATLDACIETAEILQRWSTERIARLKEYKAELEANSSGES